MIVESNSCTIRRLLNSSRVSFPLSLAFPNESNRKLLGPKMLTIEEVTPATRLLEKRRKMFEAQEALEAQKLDFAKQVELYKTIVSTIQVVQSTR